MGFLRNIIQLKRFLVISYDEFYYFFIYKYFERNNNCCDEEDISGKCVVVTGGSSGIGKSSAREFAQRGAIVVIGDVDLENGQEAVREIQRETGNVNVTILKLDLSDMDSVEEFAHKVSTAYPKIKILFNNAGIGGSKDENIKTKDGFNIHMAVNYLGHFLLTNLLMKNLKSESHPRVVSMASSLMLMSELDIDDLNMDRTKFGLSNGIPYSNTKFCLALLTKELGKHGISSYAVCPGLVNTAITISDSVGTSLRTFYRMMYPLSVSPNEAAAEFIMFCAIDKSIKDETGQVYRYRKLHHKANKIVDSVLADSLWKKSSEMVRLNERLARVK